MYFTTPLDVEIFLWGHPPTTDCRLRNFTYWDAAKEKKLLPVRMGDLVRQTCGMTAAPDAIRPCATAEMEIRMLWIADRPAAHFLLEIKQLDLQRRKGGRFQTELRHNAKFRDDLRLARDFSCRNRLKREVASGPKKRPAGHSWPLRNDTRDSSSAMPSRRLPASELHPKTMWPCRLRHFG